MPWNEARITSGLEGEPRQLVSIDAAMASM